MQDGWDYPDNVVPLQNAAAPLMALPARLPDPNAIAPREWLYGTTLIRRFISVLVAPGGTGKSMLALGRAICLASGRGFLGDHVHHRVNSWVLNLEDPLEELERRVAAMMLRHDVRRDELDGRLFLNSGRDRPLTIATVADWGEIHYPDRDAVVVAARAAQIGHIVVDPFIKSHGLEENSNPHMDAAATAWAQIGQETGAAIDLIHHTRKANGQAVDVDSARGGKALTDASRVSQTLSVMSPEEAEELGIAPADRWRHVRLDDAKANMAPRAATARWFVLDMIALHNGTDDYPNGDNVAAIAPWTPPNVLAGASARELNVCLDAIAQGPAPDVLFTAGKRGGSARWVGSVLMDRLGISEQQARPIISAWLRSGLLFEDEYKHPEYRRAARGVRVDDSKRPTE